MKGIVEGEQTDTALPTGPACRQQGPSLGERQGTSLARRRGGPRHPSALQGLIPGRMETSF